MPPGHLPVRSYLAVPVVSRSGEVVGGLFFGHSRPGVFTARAERILVGVAAQAAIAIDNARLYEASQREIAARRQAEQELQRLNETLEQRIEERTREVREVFAKLNESERQFRHLVESVADYAIFMLDTEGIVTSWNSGAERIKHYTADEIIGQHFSGSTPRRIAAAGCLSWRSARLGAPADSKWKAGACERAASGSGRV